MTGNDVRVLDNFATGHRENLAELDAEIELVEGDIQSYERVHNAVRGCELVFHLAALPSVPRSIQDPLTSTASNVTGTLNVLLAARDEGVRRVVFASSSSVYGPQREYPQREDAAARPISPYAVSKLAAEGYCRAFTQVYGLETVAVRYFNVFGPRQDPLSQYAAVIPKFITAALRGESPVIFGDGEQSRDFTYIDNTVDGTLLASTAEGVAGETFNIACGEAHDPEPASRSRSRDLGQGHRGGVRGAPARRPAALAGRHLEGPGGAWIRARRSTCVPAWREHSSTSVRRRSPAEHESRRSAIAELFALKLRGNYGFPG